MKSGDDFVPGFRIPPVDDSSLADVTVDDEATIYFNGEEVRILALPSHTTGDLIVFFTGSKVLHMGDDFFSDVGTRLRPGKNVADYFDRIAPIVAALGDDGVVLFGHGRRLSGSEFRAVYDRSIAVYHFVRDRIGKKSAEEIQSEAETANLPADWVEYYVKRLTEK
jgi:cyclase